VKNPLVLVFVALATGILLSRLVKLELLQLLAMAAILVGLALWARLQFSRLAGVAGLLTVSTVGLLLESLNTRGHVPVVDADPRETVLLSGCVVSPTAFYEGRDQFSLELAPGARARVTMTIRDGEAPPDLRYGQLVELEGRIRPLRNFQNPGGFDYQAYAALSGIFWTISVPAANPVKVKPGRCGSRLAAAIFALRTAALQRIERLYANDPYATGMMEATLIGESTKLERIWTDHFRRTGTYHMLVIDGLHISVLAAFLLFLLRLCFVPEIAALVVTAAGAWLYALVSGWNSPAVRAAGGFTLYLIARYFYRRGRVLNLLAAAAIVYLICDPGQLFEAGFQLSFMAVAAIGALAVPVLEATWQPYARGLDGISEASRDPRMPPRAAQFRLELRLLAETLHYYLRIPQAWLLHALALGARFVFYAYELAVISAAIQMGLALPMAIYFHRISLTAVSANILVVPLLALVVPLGFIAVFTGFMLPAQLAGWLLKAGEKVADWHVRFEPHWRVPGPPVWLAICFSAALMLLAFAMRRSRVWICCSTAVVVILFTLVFWHPFPPTISRGQLELTAIDVGQGDSLLISFPDSKLMLIDGGGVLSFGRKVKPRLDIGEDVVSPYLWSRSIRKIDIVALTHAHDDHARGLPAIIENFHPDELWTGVTPASEAWSEVQNQARAEKVRIIAMCSGRSFEFGGTRIEILSPPPDYLPGDTPKNNDSLAMRITYGQRSFLLTGDMERPMEQRLLVDGEPLRADVLKVGHHGSNTSSIEPFLDAVSPTFALISDGFANSFHHPHPKVLERLAGHRATILRTDLEGLITVRTDGQRISFETFRSRAASHTAYPFSAIGLLDF
jgi:competence protein ComEC